MLGRSAYQGRVKVSGALPGGGTLVQYVPESIFIGFPYTTPATAQMAPAGAPETDNPDAVGVNTWLAVSNVPSSSPVVDH